MCTARVPEHTSKLQAPDSSEILHRVANQKIEVCTALVLEHSDELNVLATNRLDDRFDASPAIVGDQLFLRGKQRLYCLSDVR